MSKELSNASYLDSDNEVLSIYLEQINKIPMLSYEEEYELALKAKNGDKKAFVSGDGGYYTHFREIGEFFGSFDLALLENGQYNKAWQYSHSFPEQTVRAAQDLRAKVVQPIHWGRFSAGTHAWNGPVDILKQLAQIAGIGYNVPQIGEVYYLGDEPKNTLWYRF